MEQKVNISNNIKIKIHELVIKDYKNQLQKLKNNKHKFDYKDYRLKYQLLHNAIKWREKELQKTKGEQDNEN